MCAIYPAHLTQIDFHWLNTRTYKKDKDESGKVT
jgi:hypothetical protein